MVRTLDHVEMDKIVSLCKRRGFIFQSSEIYGGLASTYDYGPLGIELKRNIRDAWWKRFIQDRDDMAIEQGAVVFVPKGTEHGINTISGERLVLVFTKGPGLPNPRRNKSDILDG